MVQGNILKAMWGVLPVYSRYEWGRMGPRSFELGGKSLDYWNHSMGPISPRHVRLTGGIEPW